MRAASRLGISALPAARDHLPHLWRDATGLVPIPCSRSTRNCGTASAYETESMRRSGTMNDIAEHPVRQLKERAEEGLRDASRGLTRVDGQIKRLVREKPLAMAFGAMAAGFLMGRLLSRR